MRRAGFAAAVAVAPFAFAWRFAHVYRARAGFPRLHPPTMDPSELGLPFESMDVPTPDGLTLPAWWIPARGGVPGPAVVLVHGWESGRHRTLPNAQFLNAIGYHVLTIDVRGHGANAAEELPVSAGEFGSDALAAVEAALARPDVTKVAVLGHSMGAIGAILAAAAEPRVAAVVLTATPADPYRLTRQTFRLARLPIPDPIAYPLAWLTTRVYLEPRGHLVADVSATNAIRRYGGPILAIHGTDDRVVPVAHLERLAAAAREARRGVDDAAPVETLVIPGGQHSWMYEFPVYREAVGRFLATALGGPLEADEAAQAAAAVDARRPLDDDSRFAAIVDFEAATNGSHPLPRKASTTGLPSSASTSNGPEAPEGLADTQLPVEA
jgi:dipeptidyl aminopeptidase/acylaminoacyl peptidase